MNFALFAKVHWTSVLLSDIYSVSVWSFFICASDEVLETMVVILAV